MRAIGILPNLFKYQHHLVPLGTTTDRGLSDRPAACYCLAGCLVLRWYGAFFRNQIKYSHHGYFVGKFLKKIYQSLSNRRQTETDQQRGTTGSVRASRPLNSITNIRITTQSCFPHHLLSYLNSIHCSIPSAFHSQNLLTPTTMSKQNILVLGATGKPTPSQRIIYCIEIHQSLT